MRGYEDEPDDDDDFVPLTEEGLHEAAGEVSALFWLGVFRIIFVFLLLAASSWFEIWLALAECSLSSLPPQRLFGRVS